MASLETQTTVWVRGRPVVLRMEPGTDSDSDGITLRLEVDFPDIWGPAL